MGLERWGWLLSFSFLVLFNACGGRAFLQGVFEKMHVLNVVFGW